MQLKNPLKMNDWEFRELLAVVLGIQFLLWILICLGSAGLDIFFARQFIGFIYLAFIPGVLLLRIFRIHELSNAEALVYVSGLSISTMMFMGFFANTFFPVLGVDRPISTIPLLAVMTAVVLTFCFLAYTRDRDFSRPSFIDSNGIIAPPLLFLCILPIVSVAGAQLMSVTGGNSLSMVLLVLLAIIPLLIVFDRIPSKLYPLAVFVTAIALLYDVTLASPYVTGYDVQIEYFFARAVSTSGFWNLTISDDYNSVLSITMLAPIIASICNASVAAVFKVIYQFYFALVPLGLYVVYQRQTNDKAAFLSVFYFTSIFVFYAVMTQELRQEIAELFLVLLILLIIEKKLTSVTRSSLFIIFGFSLAVSHYGLSYLYVVILILAALMSAFINPMLLRGHRIAFSNTREPRSTHSSFGPIKTEQIARNNAIPTILVLLFVVVTFSWYAFIASSHTLLTLTGVLAHGFSNVLAVFSPQAATPAGIAVSEYSPMRQITLYLSYLAEFFVVLGFVGLFRKPREMTFTDGYFSLVCANFAFVLVGVAMPLLFQFNTLRAYQIALIVLAPLFVVGGLIFFRAVTRIAGTSFAKKQQKASLTALSIFLALFLLFNSGWIYTVTNDNPTQFALNSHADAPRFSGQEVLAAQWVDSGKLNGTALYGDEFGRLLLSSFSGPQNTQVFNTYTAVARGENGIILFRSTNLEGTITMTDGQASLTNSSFYQNSVANSNLVYDNGAARAYHP